VWSPDWAHSVDGTAPASLVDEEDGMKKQNVGDAERWMSALGGGALALWGLWRRSWAGLGAAAAGGALAWRGLSGWCGLYQALGIDRGRSTVGNLGVKIEREVVVAAPAEPLYRFWRRLENLPQIMSHLEAVEPLDATRSRWRAKAPGGIPIEWEAEVINEQAPHLIAWQTRSTSPVAHAGSVRFVPLDGATKVVVSLQYDPPGGSLAHAAAALMDADAGARIEHDLQEFRRAIENGRLAA
jgi:uncharacterized membrane protein